MSIIPAQSLTQINGFPVDSQSVLIFWGQMNAGDEGEPVEVFGFDHLTWQFTGSPQGGVITNPNVPIDPSRTVTVYGSLDRVCFVKPLFSLTAGSDAPGMNSRLGDPYRVSNPGDPETAFQWVKPIVTGTPNPAGADCSLLLFCFRKFGPRT